MEMFKFKKENIMVRDMVRGMMEQGIADEDILEIMGRAGVPSEMAASMLNRIKEEIELQGIKSRKSVAREEMDAALWEACRDLEMKIHEIRKDLEACRQENKDGLNAVKKRLEDTSSSIKSFEIYAREILKALKKSQP
jgi:hypothetical protein